MGSIQQAFYDELLRRTTDQYGGGSKVGEALEDLFPTLDVENLPSELLRSRGWVLGMGSMSRTSAVANTNNLALFNPVGSGLLLVLTKFIFYSESVSNMLMGPIFTALTDANLAGAQRDTRNGQISRTVGRLQRQDNAAASAFGLFRANAAVNVVFEDPNGIAVLAPGTGFQLHNPGTNTTDRASFFWREREALPPELNF